MNAAGFSLWADLNQVHGDVLVPATGVAVPDRESSTCADGHFTLSKEVGLTILTADCQPLFLVRKDGGAIAALHVGWRGNACNFPGSAVVRLCQEFSCKPKDLYAVRGPSLGPTASEFVNFAKEWPAEFLPWFKSDQKTVDLWELTRHQLQEAGLYRNNIYSLDLCTHTMNETFFSYRRKDGGRLINAIWME